MELVERTPTRAIAGRATWLSPFSGFTYVLRMVTDAQYTAALKTVVAIASQNGSNAVTPQNVEDNAAFRRALVKEAIESCDVPSWKGDAGELPYPDVNSIQNWVQTGKKLAGPEADDLRRVLPVG